VPQTEAPWTTRLELLFRPFLPNRCGLFNPCRVTLSRREPPVEELHPFLYMLYLPTTPVLMCGRRHIVFYFTPAGQASFPWIGPCICSGIFRHIDRFFKEPPSRDYFLLFQDGWRFPISMLGHDQKFRNGRPTDPEDLLSGPPSIRAPRFRAWLSPPCGDPYAASHLPLPGRRYRLPLHLPVPSWTSKLLNPVRICPSSYTFCPRS